MPYVDTSLVPRVCIKTNNRLGMRLWVYLSVTALGAAHRSGVAEQRDQLRNNFWSDDNSAQIDELKMSTRRAA